MTNHNIWTDEWLKAQQKFTDSWSDMAKGLNPAGSASQSNLWADGMKMWSQGFDAAAQPDAKQVFDKCMDVGKGYFAMAEQIGKNSVSAGNPYEAINQWLEQMKSGLQQQTGQWSPTSSQNINDFMSQWISPLDSWQKMTSAMLPAQQALGQMFGANTPSFNMGEAIDPMGNMLSAPGIGYFREPQEKMQKGFQLALEYQQSNTKYNQAFMRVSLESIQGFQNKLQQQATAQDAETLPSSLRELYDHWIVVSEEHYAEFAMSEEYQTLYGDMVNRLMALKKHTSETADELMQSMNMPSRSEVDTMQQRLQQMRRDNFALRDEIRELKSMSAKSNDTPTKQEVSALQDEIKEMKSMSAKSNDTPTKQEVSALQDEIKEMKSMLRKINSAPQKAGAATQTSIKKTTVKKATPPKKAVTKSKPRSKAGA